MPSSQPEKFQDFLNRQQLTLLKPIAAVCLAVEVTVTLAHQVLLGSDQLHRDIVGLTFYTVLFLLLEREKI